MGLSEQIDALQLENDETERQRTEVLAEIDKAVRQHGSVVPLRKELKRLTNKSLSEGAFLSDMCDELQQRTELTSIDSRSWFEKVWSSFKGFW